MVIKQSRFQFSGCASGQTRRMHDNILQYLQKALEDKLRAATNTTADSLCATLLHRPQKQAECSTHDEGVSSSWA